MLLRSFNVNLWLSKKNPDFENLIDWCFLLLCSHNRNLHTAYCQIQRVVLADTDWVWNELYAHNSTSILENLKFEMYSSFLWNVTISLLLLCSLKSFCCRWHKLHRSLKILLPTLKTSSYTGHRCTVWDAPFFFQGYSFMFI